MMRFCLLFRLLGGPWWCCCFCRSCLLLVLILVLQLLLRYLRLLRVTVVLGIGWCVSCLWPVCDM